MVIVTKTYQLFSFAISEGTSEQLREFMISTLTISNMPLNLPKSVLPSHQKYNLSTEANVAIGLNSCN